MDLKIKKHKYGNNEDDTVDEKSQKILLVVNL